MRDAGRLRRTFDRYAASAGKRRAWSAANPGNQAIRRELVDAVLALVPLAPGARVLDAGCGTGWWLRELAARGVAGLHGVD
ncbi:MAG: methyltransferase domain-containing protein, partial [Solirubrobacteraceae bacterium]